MLPAGQFSEPRRQTTEAQQLSWTVWSLTMMLDQANAPIFTIDRSGFIVTWNDYMERISKVPRAKAAKTKLDELLDPASRANLNKATWDVWESKLGPSVSLQVNDSCTITVGMSPQFDVNGNVVGAFCVGHEVGSDPNAGAGDNGKTHSNYANLNAAMSKLRAPLQGMIALSSTLSQEETPFQKPLKMISTGAERVLETVTNLMDFWALTEDQGADLSLTECVGVASIMEDVLHRCQLAPDRRGAPLKKKRCHPQS